MYVNIRYQVLDNRQEIHSSYIILNYILTNPDKSWTGHLTTWPPLPPGLLEACSAGFSATKLLDSLPLATRYRATWQPSPLEACSPEFLATRLLNSLPLGTSYQATWQAGKLAFWKHVKLAFRPQGCWNHCHLALATRLPGNLATWLSGSMLSWLSGHKAAGIMATWPWLPGYLATWQPSLLEACSTCLLATRLL